MLLLCEFLISTICETPTNLLFYHRGYIFESGGLRSEVGEKSFDTPYERELFRRLGIPYLPPELRNADP